MRELLDDVLIKNQDENDIYTRYWTLDDALEAVGFGTFHLILLVLSGVGYAAGTVEIAHISLLIPKIEFLIKSCKFPIGYGDYNDCQIPNNLTFLIGLMISVVAVGQFIGGMIWAFLADRWGRRKVFLYTTLASTLLGIMCSWANSLMMLIIMRFFLGIAIGGSLSIDFVFFVECVASNLRGSHSSFLIVFGILGGIIGYLALDQLGWRTFIVLVNIPNLIVTVLRVFWPYESPTYLLHNGKTQEAIKVLRNMARMNGVALPNFELISRPSRKQIVEDDVFIIQEDEISSDISQNSLHHDFNGRWTKHMTWTALRFSVLWFCLAFGFYGITSWISKYLKVKNIKSPIGIYENFIILALSEIPGLLLTMMIIDRIGRQKTLALFLFGCTISCFSFILITKPFQVVLCLCMIYFFVVGAWATLYIYTPEAFPTSHRNIGFALTNIGAVAAGILTGTFGGWLFDINVPSQVIMSIYGVSFLVGSLFAVIGMGSSSETSMKPLMVTHRYHRVVN